MRKVRISKAVIGLTAYAVMASCTADENPTTFRGEPLIIGADPNAVIRTIDDPNYPAVMLTRESGAVGIGIFQRETGSPVLTLRDADNDGVFDLLTYTSLSATGEALVDVVDYGMDGQPDHILNFQVPSASVFVDGRWHEVDGVGTENVTVEIDGRRVSVTEILAELRQKK